VTSAATRWRLASLWAVLGLTALACGGTGSNADRKKAAAAENQTRPAFNDPGSMLTYDCEVDQPSKGIITRTLEDWETTAGTGWYTNNDRCENCQPAMDKINAALPDTPTQALIDAGLIDAGAVDAGLAELAACRPACLPSQIPSYFDKPVPAEAIPSPVNHKEPGRCGSKYAFHVIAGPFSKWGGQLGHTFGTPICATSEADCPVDSAPIPGGPYDGIAFWARVVPGSGSSMRIQVGESHTDVKYPETGDAGPPCVDNVGIENPNNTTDGCDSFGSFVTLNSDWQFFALPFEEMRQAGWGKRAPFFDIQHISNITFFYAQGVWDIWLDDISFYKRSAQ
jgi:hypothetical protein